MYSPTHGVRMRATRRMLALTAFALLGVAGTSHAQEIQFQGSTKGCFYASWETGCAPASSSTLMYLSYTSSTFDVTTVDGLAGIGAAPGAPNVNNLGSFTVGGDPASYTGSHFLLDVVFALPTITSSPSLFTASVKGSVASYANGLVKINFDPGSQVFDFANGDETGSFVLSVNNVSMTPGTSPMSLSGDIEVTNVTATPEPGTTALLATGLFGLVPVVRSRRKKSVA
jgi:hypothetical protein